MEDPVVPNSTPEAPKPTLTYEETPIIEPIADHVTGAVTPTQPSVEHAPVPPPQSPSQHTSNDPVHTSPPPTASVKKSKGKHVGNFIFFVILFGLGIWLSLQLRTFLSGSTELASINNEPTVAATTPIVTQAPLASGSAKPSGSPASQAAWVTYQVQSGSGKKIMTGVSYQLPPEVTAPVCDGGNCPSLGTNLPGGTRFTVAARGKGYTLPDFRGAILTDASGHEFAMKQSIVGGKSVYQYIGDFSGRTGGGYSFTKMRGVLVPVTDTISVEFNHFSPVGITTDFATDDVLFDKIIASFNTTILPDITSTPKAATSSGL